MQMASVDTSRRDGDLLRAVEDGLARRLAQLQLALNSLSFGEPLNLCLKRGEKQSRFTISHTE